MDQRFKKNLPSRKSLSGPILWKAAAASVDGILPKVIFLLTLLFLSNEIKNLSIFYYRWRNFVTATSANLVLCATRGFQWQGNIIYSVCCSICFRCVISLRKRNWNRKWDFGIPAQWRLCGKTNDVGFLQFERNFGIIIGSVCTDDTDQCARAKSILSLRFPNLYFGRCYAHQVHLIVKDVFKISFVEVIESARKLITKYNQSTFKWLVRLNKINMEWYGKSLALLRIMEVRWNSLRAALDDLKHSFHNKVHLVCVTSSEVESWEP